MSFLKSKLSSQTTNVPTAANQNEDSLSAQKIKDLEQKLAKKQKDLSVVIEEVMFAEKEIASLKALSEKKDKEIEKLKHTLIKIGKNQQQEASPPAEDKSEALKEIKILSERNKNLEEQINLLEEENENIRNQVLTITHALDVSEEELNKQRNFVRDQESAVKMKDSTIESLQQALTDLEKEAKRLEEKKEKYRKECENANIQHQELLEQVASWRHKYEDASSRVESLEKEKANNNSISSTKEMLNMENKELREMYSRSLLELEEMNQAFNEVKRQLIEKQEKMKELDIEKSQLEEENHNLTAEISALYAQDFERKQKENANNLLENQSNLNELLSNSEKTVMTMDKTVSIIQKHLNDSKTGNDDDYAVLVSSQQEQIESLLLEISNLKKQLKETLKNGAEASKLEMEESATVKQLKEDIENKDQTIRTMEDNINRLNQEITSLKNVNNEKSEIEKLKQEYADLEKEKNHFHSQSEMYQYELSSLTTDYNQLLERSEELAQLLEKDLSEKVVVAVQTDTPPEINDDSNEIERLEKENDELREMANHFQNQADELIEKLKTKYEQEETERIEKVKHAKIENELKEKINNYEQEMTILKEENELLRNRVFESIDNDNTRLKIEKQQKLIDALEKSLESAKKSLREGAEIFKKELQDAISKERNDHMAVIEEMKKEIETLLAEREELRQGHPQNPDDAIKQATARIAFHNEVVRDMQQDLVSTRTALSEINQGVEKVMGLLKQSDLDTSQEVLKHLHDIALAMDAKSKLLDTRIQLNISVEFNRKLQASLEEKESLLHQAVEYVNNLQKEYNQCKETLKKLIEERSSPNTKPSNTSMTSISTSRAPTMQSRAKSTEKAHPTNRTNRGYANSFHK
ncbi:hypothetical protein C9374_010838 [Naegleria lovaniensis]|uniref:Uncharacterized protein n=1 Tax=Naegleria lovaniensis TaxID=51637 RepID=A0AA88KDM8_NAELO|nr:uncharacterized protein C9374_013059 [Naegleria lovaniensis]XP_044543442.1 uncharacterized protein C9374_010838 [Naegleria lovaniensis]KAG2372937.1 hypothetical protein C9374_013059 [Naegleria lovaniensis]KAG2374268.1 hypothetical protein C9374_010838 [Naegleria lovaniensis]